MIEIAGKKLPDWVGLIVGAILNGRAVAGVFNIFLGRATFFAIAFAGFGIYGWLKGHEIGGYAAFVTATQGLIVLHSWKQDVDDQREAEREIAKLWLELRHPQSSAPVSGGAQV